MLVEFCAGMVLTVDGSYGLRAWIAGNPRSCVASASLSGLESKPPTALTATRSRHQNAIEIGVGFQDGHFKVYDLDLETLRLHLRFDHTGSGEGAISAMASSSSYLLTVTQHKILSLYEFPTELEASEKHDSRGPRQLASLHAESIVAPVSLSLRTTRSEIIASIVYNFFHLGCAWSLGIQELRLNKNGQQVGSQLATTVDSQYGIKPSQSFPRLGRRCSTSAHSPLRSGIRIVPTEASIVHQEPPTSISYSHPYLLTSHADNTLTMYLVVSTSENLFIRSGQRLWGHTSSVSTVQVSDRGKAVSVSSRGDEIRIWELEPAISLFGMARELKEESSIPVTPENKQDRNHQDLGSIRRVETSGLGTTEKLEQMRKRVGFDEERVLLVREREVGSQLVACYDFT